ncbi:MAG: hypothetical protein L0Z62_49955 [Gemmataceae bacterium]|nr:hypothetical protein [Gemmataceae bacterium]
MTRSATGTAGWIVAPAFDLLFLANLGWLLALVPGFFSAEGTPHIEFWQIYFLTTPHRWITLFLVALDPDRREGRSGWFVALAALALAVVGGVWLSSGAFVCLFLIDYIWNGWHFASQHHGVLRIYSRKVGGSWPGLERWGLRLFIFYVIARTAGWSTGWLEETPVGLPLLHTLDLLVLAVPAGLLSLELRERAPARLGKRVYLASVCGLYAGLLLALRAASTPLILALTTASAMFHAVEYLAIVTHYAWRRQAHGSAGLFRIMAGRWLGVLAAYVVLLGLFGVMLERQWGELWLGLNLWAAFLHYTYDGMIWKLRRPATARTLGAEQAAVAQSRAVGVLGHHPPAQATVPVTAP